MQKIEFKGKTNINRTKVIRIKIKIGSSEMVSKNKENYKVSIKHKYFQNMGKWKYLQNEMFWRMEK